MEIACLDLEGVLVPEIWIAFAEKTGIESLRATTRDIPDYDVLMKQRLRILDEHGLKLSDIQAVIALKSLYYRVIAAGDSYNDTTMLSEAHAGILFHAPDNVIAEFPQFPAVHTYEDLKQEFLKASVRELSL